MKNAILILVLAAAACASPDTSGVSGTTNVGALTDWRYDPQRGYVRGNQTASENEFLEMARRTTDHEQAAGMFDLLVRYARNPSTTQEAYFGRGSALTQAGLLGEAYNSYLQFLNAFPGSDRELEAKRQLFEISRLMVTAGTTKYVLAIPYSSPEDGIQRMKRTLEMYPREDFSPSYAFWLAEYLFQEKRIDEAQVEYLFIVETYIDHPVVPAAMFKLGECELDRYKGTRFDSAPLKSADKWYQRVQEEFRASPTKQAADQRRAFVQEELASKEFAAGEFYEGKGHRNAAVAYYKYVIEKYPKTSYASLARENLIDLGVVPPDQK